MLHKGILTCMLNLHISLQCNSSVFQVLLLLWWMFRMLVCCLLNYLSECQQTEHLFCSLCAQTLLGLCLTFLRERTALCKQHFVCIGHQQETRHVPVIHFFSTLYGSGSWKLVSLSCLFCWSKTSSPTATSVSFAFLFRSV